MSKFEHLFQPMQVGNLVSRNRIVVSTHTKLYGSAGTDSQRTIDYYEARAKGGAGILFTDSWLVHPSSSLGLSRRNWASQLALRPEANKRLVKVIKDNGGLAFTQIAHNGAASQGDSGDDLRAIWGPSPVKSPISTDVPKEMEHSDIRELVDAFATAADTIRGVGYDGVEILAAHGYLIHEFLSPMFNKRTDEYGGSFENRARLLREIIAGVRERVGRDWCVGVRMSASDTFPGGLDETDAGRLTELLVQDGLIDFINVSGGGYHDASQMNAPSDVGDAYFADYAGHIRKFAGGLPVFAGDGIRFPEHAEKLLADGKADAVSMARAMIADPEWALKAQEGRAEDITHCIRGNQGCFSRILRGFPAGCTVNPSAGREGRLGPVNLTLSSRPESWIVVGGGPAGMRAALTLARRGHDVTLLERDPVLGGQVNMILETPGRASFVSVIRDLARGLNDAGVKIETGVEATAGLIESRNPDHVIIATGARPAATGFSTFNPLVESIPGVESPHVMSVWDVLKEKKPISGRVVVLDDDGSRYSAGVVEVLQASAESVELVCPFPAPFHDTMTTIDMAPIYRRVMSAGLRARPNSWAMSIGGDSVDVLNFYTGSLETIPADIVVLCTSRLPVAELYFELKDRFDVHRIGDAVTPRRIDHAIYEGELAGRELWTIEERTIYDGELERLRDEPAADLAPATS